MCFSVQDLHTHYRTASVDQERGFFAQMISRLEGSNLLASGNFHWNHVQVSVAHLFELKSYLKLPCCFWTSSKHAKLGKLGNQETNLAKANSWWLWKGQLRVQSSFFGLSCLSTEKHLLKFEEFAPIQSKAQLVLFSLQLLTFSWQ